MLTYITTSDELELIPTGVRVCGTWTEHQYVSDTLGGCTTFGRLGDPNEEVMLPSDVLGAEIQVYVHHDDTHKALRILEALEVCAPAVSPTLRNLLARLRGATARPGA